MGPGRSLMRLLGPGLLGIVLLIMNTIALNRFSSVEVMDHRIMLHVPGFCRPGSVSGLASDENTIVDNNTRYAASHRVNATSADIPDIVALGIMMIHDTSATSGPHVSGTAALIICASAIDPGICRSRAHGTFYTLGGRTVNDSRAATATAMATGLNVTVRLKGRFRTSSPPHLPTANASEIMA